MRSYNNSALIIVLVLAVICFGLIIYFVSLPEPDSEFTEFYLLNSSGQPCNYPITITAGQPFTLTVGIVNREAQPLSYTVRIISNGRIIREMETGILEKGKKGEYVTSITLTEAAPAKKIEFYLFLKGQNRPHIERPLVLTVDVVNP